MSSIGVILIALVSALVGAVLAWLFQQQRIAGLKAERDRAESEGKIRFDLAREKDAENAESLERVNEQIETKLRLMAKELLEGTSRSFSEDAQKVFKEQLVRPINEKLDQYQKRLTEFEKERSEVQALARHQIDQMLLEARELNSALRQQPSARGQWGEMQLRRVLEMAGMQDHVDFEEQVTLPDGDKRQRPDAVVRMPGDRRLVIDAKTPMSAYWEAMQESDPKQRQERLAAHARAMRKHADDLGSKKYWDKLEGAPDFVVMFVPGDHFYVAAVENDPELFNDAYRHNVVVATPMTLLALAKAIAYGWRQEQFSRDFDEVRKLGNDLYKRFEVFVGHLNNLGGALNNTVLAHSKLIGSFESRLLPGVRKLHVHGIGQQKIEPVEPVEEDVRMLQVGVVNEDGTKPDE